MTAAVATSPPPPLYDPNRVATLDQIDATFSFLATPIWIFDYVETRVPWANAAALELWNSPSLEEMQSRDFSQMSDCTKQRNEEILCVCRQGQRKMEQWTFYPKGQAKTVQCTIGGIRLRDRNSSTAELPHMSMLIEGKPLENSELDNELVRGVEMLRHLPIAVCQFDLQGNCMFQNPEACLLEEAQEEGNGTVEEIQGQEKKDGRCSENNKKSLQDKKRKKADCSLLHRFVDPKVGQKVVQQLQNDTRPFTEQTLELEAMVHSHRGPTWSAIQIRGSVDPVTGQPVFLYSATDKTDAVTARKEREAREQKSEFLAIMAHEIRTPLHQVMGFIDLLDQTELNHEQRSFVSVLKSSAQGLMTVINDVLDFSKLEAGKLQLECIPYEPLSVTKATIQAVTASCEEKQIYLKLDWDPKIPFRLQNDPNRLRQILLNLLSNAVKFTKRGGITVRAQYVKGTEDNQIRFSVQDTGIGISPEHKQVIFEKYTQANHSIARNYGGTGLGLSICSLLVQMMGGTLGVESDEGKGTTFWFVLPAAEPTEKTLDTSNEKLFGGTSTRLGASPGEPEEGLHILVAEDNKVNQKLVVKMLNRLGHSAEVAENGKQAIEMIEQQGKKPYNLCLMDIQMPVCDGLEATKRLRSMGYTTLPIYGLTASVHRSDFVELGFDDWLPKPIRMKDLKIKLHQLKQRLDHDSQQSLQEEGPQQ